MIAAGERPRRARPSTDMVASKQLDAEGKREDCNVQGRRGAAAPRIDSTGFELIRGETA